MSAPDWRVKKPSSGPRSSSGKYEIALPAEIIRGRVVLQFGTDVGELIPMVQVANPHFIGHHLPTKPPEHQGGVAAVPPQHLLHFEKPEPGDRVFILLGEQDRPSLLAAYYIGDNSIGHAILVLSAELSRIPADSNGECIHTLEVDGRKMGIALALGAYSEVTELNRLLLGREVSFDDLPFLSHDGGLGGIATLSDVNEEGIDERIMNLARAEQYHIPVGEEPVSYLVRRLGLANQLFRQGRGRECYQLIDEMQIIPRRPNQPR